MDRVKLRCLLLNLIDSSVVPLTGSELYHQLSKRDTFNYLPGDIAHEIWSMVGEGILSVRTDLKVVRA